MDLFLKIILVGASGTGKTSIMRRYVAKEFIENRQATIGVDFGVQALQHHPRPVKTAGAALAAPQTSMSTSMPTMPSILPQQFTLQLWDIAGQDRRAGISKGYFDGACAAVIVVDVTQHTSLEAAVEWRQAVKEACLATNAAAIPCVVFINKVDRQPDVATDAASPFSAGSMAEFCRRNDMVGFCYVSALLAGSEGGLEEGFCTVVDWVVESGTHIRRSRPPARSHVKLQPRGARRAAQRHGDECENDGLAGPPAKSSCQC